MNGFGRDLAALFALELDVELRVLTFPNHAELAKKLRSGEIHLAAAMPVAQPPNGIVYSAPILETRQLLVQHASALPIDDPVRLAGREISVLPDAVQISFLKELPVNPPPLIEERKVGDEIDLFAGVARRRFDLAAGDELHFDIAANYYPDISVAMALPGKLAYAWAFPADLSKLRDEAALFLDNTRQDGKLRRIKDRYFGHLKRLDANDMQSFLLNVRSRLPAFRQAFHEAQELTGIDWRLLAALGYQESKWDPLATSPTGVRGLMMLTSDTADRLGVGNRLDARESIRAGARYLAMLMEELPVDIRHPDRLWLALAAYNLGMGHLRGARSIAQEKGLDPRLWVDLKEALPLLSLPEYYERLKSGRARGGEAVLLVENIRNYYDALCRFEPIYTPPTLDFSSGGRKTGERKRAATR